MRRLSVWPAFAGLLLLTAALCAAGDWPQFRGPGRDGHAPDVKLPETWPSRLETVWETAAGAGFSSPAVAGGRVFVIAGEERSCESVRCLDAATGREVWRHTYRACFQSGWGDGPRATPAVEGGRVYAVGGTGELHCLGVERGEVVWRASFERQFRFRTPEYGYSPSPLVDGDRLIAHVGGTGGDSIVALDKATGRVLWKALDDPPGYASPMIVPASETRGPRQLVAFTERGLVSVDPDDGRLNWRYHWTTEYQQNIAQPILQGDLLVLASLSGAAGLRRAAEGGRPAVREVWRTDRVTTHFSCLVGSQGFLYGVTGRGGRFSCIEAESGRVVWETAFPCRQRAGVVLADGRLIAYTDTGRLVVLDASFEAFRERARIEVAGRNWVPPVLAQGCLFLRDHKGLRCLRLPAAAP